MSVVFKRPFDEQVAFFRGKLGNLVPTATWRDLWKGQHDRAFMVAGAAKADLLADLAGAVDKSIAEGETIQAFRKRFGEIVQRNGWHGWTGEGTPAGEAWRTRVIYETNLATSYGAGRLAQLKQGEYPYWMYRHAEAVARPRPQHLAWDGLTLPPDHAFWKTHSPPNGWGCKCRVIGVRSASQAKRLGGDPNKAVPKGWDQVDPKTGELPGIDKGWGYQPGESVSDAMKVAAKKTVQWDYMLAKAYMSDVPAAQRDALTTAIRTQPETGEAVRRYAQRVLGKAEADVPPYQTMGLLTTDEAKQIAEMTGVEAVGKELYDWTVDSFTIQKVLIDHGTEATEAPRGQAPIVAADYAVLPQVIAESKEIEDAGKSDIGRPVVKMTAVIEGRRWVAVFEVRAVRRMLALQTFYKGRK
ncbi:MAG: phage head protein [Deltaproteobacteria bacterium]|nr:phage head protein [Deltaproteobacteria bacterium]